MWLNYNFVWLRKFLHKLLTIRLICVPLDSLEGLSRGPSPLFVSFSSNSSLNVCRFDSVAFLPSSISDSMIVCLCFPQWPPIVTWTKFCVFILLNEILHARDQSCLSIFEAHDLSYYDCVGFLVHRFKVINYLLCTLCTPCKNWYISCIFHIHSISKFSFQLVYCIRYRCTVLR